MSDDLRDWRCPMCNHKLSGTPDYSVTIRKLYDKRSQRAQRAIRLLSKTIMEHIPAENTVKHKAQFMWAIQDVPDRIVEKSIEDYINGGHYADCKGYAYAKAIINSNGKNDAKRKENERKRYGIVPPVEIL